MELIFGTLGVILEVQKKSRKKDAKNEQTQRPPGPARRNARVPGEDLGGVKTQQKGEEQQGAEQRRGGDHRTLPSDLTRSLPPSPGGGRIDHPQGGTTARPPFRAVPQRAVDIIWRCAGGDQHNAVCWVCAGFVLGLCQVCAGVVLGLCWVAGFLGAAIAKFLAAFVGRSR